MKNIPAYKEKLEGEKVRLEESLASVGRKNPNNQADWEAMPEGVEQEADIMDTAANVEAYETNDAILRDLEIRYNEVLAALARIEAGTFGTCEVSGEPIEEDRLEADPAAKTCKAHM